MNRHTAWKHRKRLALFHDQDERCFWCRVPMVLNDTTSPLYCTIDHIYPRGDSRRSKWLNEPKHVAACVHCNNTRSDTPLETFLTTISTAFSWVLPNGELALHPHHMG